MLQQQTLLSDRHLFLCSSCLTTALNAAGHRMDTSGKPSTAQIVVLATSSALTALFYSIYKNRATTVARLKVSHISAHSVFVTWMSAVCEFNACYVPCVNLDPQEAKKVSIDQDLKNILSETPGRCVPYAVIEGELGHIESLKDLNSPCTVISIFLHCPVCHTLQVLWGLWRKLWAASLLITAKAWLKGWPWRRKRWCGIAPLICGKWLWSFIL